MEPLAFLGKPDHKESEEEDDTGYTIIGGDEVEVLPEEPEVDDDTGNDDE